MCIFYCFKLFYDIIILNRVDRTALRHITLLLFMKILLGSNRKIYKFLYIICNNRVCSINSESVYVEVFRKTKKTVEELQKIGISIRETNYANFLPTSFSFVAKTGVAVKEETNTSISP